MRECRFNMARWDRDNPPTAVNIYTDASSRKIGPDQWASSWAFVIVRADYQGNPIRMQDTDEVIAEHSGISNLPTNAAELHAVGQALAYCMLYLNPFMANIRTDSLLAADWLRGNKRIKSPTVIPTWEAVQPLLAVTKTCGRYQMVRIFHVKGHAGNKNNERADLLAGQANDSRHLDYPDDFLAMAWSQFIDHGESTKPQDIVVDMVSVSVHAGRMAEILETTLGGADDVTLRWKSAVMQMMDSVTMMESHMQGFLDTDVMSDSEF